jgi:hypothetical protein
VPVVEGRAPLWEAGDELPVATGLATDRREVLITTALDAIPDNRHPHPGPSHWPLVMALAMGVTFIGAVWTPWAYVVGFAMSAVAFAGWGWPRGTHPDEIVVDGILPRTSARGGWRLRAEGGGGPLTLELGRDDPEGRLARFVSAHGRTLGALERAGTKVDAVDLRYRNGFAARVPAFREKGVKPAA